MRFLIHFFILISVVVAFAACAPATQEPAAEEPPCTEADVEALKKLLKEYEAAINAADTAAWLALLTDDAIWMPPEEAILVGKEKIGPWGQAAFDYANLEYGLSAEEIEVAGDWAYLRGNHTVTVAPKDGAETRKVSGKHIYILQRQRDGSWKFRRSIWNGNPPPGS